MKYVVYTEYIKFIRDTSGFLSRFATDALVENWLENCPFVPTGLFCPALPYIVSFRKFSFCQIVPIQINRVGVFLFE